MTELRAGGAAVTVVRSARRRRTIAIGVSGGVVTVRAPLRTPMREIEVLLGRKADWIRRRLELDAEANRPRPELVTGTRVLFLGRELAVRVSEIAGTRGRVALGEGGLEVFAPAGIEGGADRALMAWFRRQAADVLGESVVRWSGLTGLAPRRVIVKEQKRRWGSCGPDGVIRLNWRLVMAPREVIDYVVVHELAHLRHRNHGPNFWAEVERAMPQHKQRRKELRALAPMLSSGPVLPGA